MIQRQNQAINNFDNQKYPKNQFKNQNPKYNFDYDVDKPYNYKGHP